MQPGEILQVASIISTVAIGIGFVWAIRANTMVLTTRLDGVDRQIAAVEKDVKKMTDVMLMLSEQSGRLNLLDERQTQTRKSVDEAWMSIDKLKDQLLQK